MCAYAGGLYAETFALIVDVTIVLFSVYLCTHLKACLALYVKDRHYILWCSLEFTYALAVPTSLVCLLFKAYWLESASDQLMFKLFLLKLY